MKSNFQGVSIPRSDLTTLLCNYVKIKKRTTGKIKSFNFKKSLIHKFVWKIKKWQLPEITILSAEIMEM